MSRWFLLLLIPLFLFAYPLTPPIDGSYCTPNDPDFREYRYIEQIPVCYRNVTTQQKNDICLRDDVTNRTNYTVDHLIPLSMGGSNHFDNLWCQHKKLNVTADEYSTYVRLRDGSITQQEAIQYLLDLKFNRIEREE